VFVLDVIILPIVLSRVPWDAVAEGRRTVIDSVVVLLRELPLNSDGLVELATRFRDNSGSVDRE
jgi:hypothetical protein